MDNIQNISISKIVDVLSSSKLIVPKPDIWKKIFYNTGLGDIYEQHRNKLTVTHKQISWEDYYYHNEKSFSALLEIFSDIYYDFEVFIKLLNNILNKFCLYSIFDEDIESYIKNKS